MPLDECASLIFPMSSSGGTAPVLAKYSAELDDQYTLPSSTYAEREQERIASSVYSQRAPSSVYSPRIPSPEPYLPLRKASPHQLHARRAPHPLFLTSQNGSQGFGPATASTAASPYHTNVNASRKSSLYPDSLDEEHEPGQEIITMALQSPRKQALQWNLPVAAIPPSHQPSSPRLRTSRSMTEGLRGIRAQLSSYQQDADSIYSRPVDDAQSNIDLAKEDARTSFRSAMTSSSFMDSTISTGRSSLGTGNSSASDFVNIYPTWPETDENNLTVEDAIGMYADGFETPMKQSFDLSLDRRDSSPEHRRPSSALIGLGKNRAHRRSQSASFLDTSTKVGPSRNEAPEPRPVHGRTVTHMVTTRDMASGPAQETVFRVPRDRYGFKKASQYISLDKYDKWEGPYSQHLERRRIKWIALMKSSGLSIEQPFRFPPKSDKVKRYVRKGIPPKWRGAAWFWYAGGPGLLQKNQGLYWTLLDKIKRGGHLSDTDREHIERDLNRTFPDNIQFKPDPTNTVNGHDNLAPGMHESVEELETPIVQALRRVLQAFAVHNPGIGYCQSLNFIAGLLLLFLDSDEEKTFILMNVITSDHLPGTHGISLEGANIDIAVLMTSIKDYLPGIWAKLDDQPPNQSVASGPARLPTVSLATTAWFMSLFVGTLPIECVLRVWDCLFYEGSKTLFRVALAIFKAGEAAIHAVNDPMEIFQVVQSMPRGMIDANTLMETCFRRRNGFGALTQEVVEKMREERRVVARMGKTLTMTAETPKKGSKVGRMKSKPLSRFRSKSVKVPKV